MTYIPQTINTDPKSFVTAANGQFLYKGSKFRFVGLNFYPLLVNTMSQSDVSAFFQACATKNISVVRTWAFDASNPPTNSAGNFQYLDYPIGTNLISNGDFETNTTGWGNGTYSGGAQGALNSSVFTRSTDTAENGTYSMKMSTTWGTYDSMSYQATVTASTNYVWTIWHKIQAIAGDGSHFPPVYWIGDATNSTNMHEVLDAGIQADDGGVWKKTQILFNSGSNTQVNLNIKNFGGQNLCYFDNISLSVATTPTIAYREASYQQLDMVVNEAQKAGVKLILSFADNPTYGTKQAYCHLADAINGTSLEAAGSPYVGFFDNTNCRTLYKAHLGNVLNRTNTVNGRLYKDDDTIFSWELGNELRYDLFTSEGGTQNTAASTDIIAVKNWIIDVSTYIKSQDPNHMVNYGDCAHTWQWVNGDVVSNGSGYGVDYNIFATITTTGGLPALDFMDYHTYPNQADGIHLQEYGQRLGFSNAVSGAGYVAQLKDFISAAHTNNKPAVIGEVGLVVENVADNTYYTLYPRYAFMKQFLQDFFDNGGDGVIPWHGSSGSTASSYDIALNASGGESTTDNSNDTKLVSVLAQRAYQVNGQKIPTRVVKGITI